MIKTRVAPSPTGMFHLGTARQAVHNWLYAKHHGGKFILRIDDTDEERNTPENVSIILQSLEYLELSYDEIHYQSKRTSLYEDALKALRANGSTHPPLDDSEAVYLNCSNNAWTFTDGVCGEVTAQVHPDGVPALAIRRSYDNGEGALYHFANVVDDVEMGITDVIRGSDHLTNTAKHLAIADALGAQYPTTHHVGLIFKDKKKMSKRDGAASLLDYRDAGVPPLAMMNFLMRMGWGISEKGLTRPELRAINFFPSVEECIARFGEGTLRAASSNFDEAKLQHYIKKAS